MEKLFLGKVLIGDLSIYDKWYNNPVAYDKRNITSNVIIY